MKFIISFLLSVCCFFSFSQTTPLSFTNLSGDYLRYNAGFQNWGNHTWNDITQPTIPTGNTLARNYYQRFNLGDIVSDAGVFNWTTFDNQINIIIDNNSMFTIGFMALCDGCPGTHIPTYIQTAMTAEGKPGPNIGGVIYPNYQSNAWKNGYCAILRAVANHINTTSRSGKPYSSAFQGLDFRYFMNFGEGGDPIPTGTYGAGAQVTDTYLMAMTDSMIAIFPDVALTVPFQYITPTGNTYGNANGNTGQQAAYYLLTRNNNYGKIGWRRDNIGDPGYTTDIITSTGSYNPGDSVHNFKYLMIDRWKLATVGGEPSSSESAVATNAGCGATNLYCDMHNENLIFHMSYCGNGNAPGGISNGSGAKWTNLQANWRNSSAEQGYKIILTGGIMTTTLVNGSNFTVAPGWQNIGLAPVYDTWQVVYELRNATTGTLAASWNSNFNLKLFLPSGSPTVNSENFLITGVTPGLYNLLLIIKDPNNYKLPFALAITGRTASGQYLIRSNINVTNSLTPTANAGPDASITLPTNSYLLDGSASVAATSYLWTQVSGPNTATLTTTTNVTCPANGLIAGAYVFRNTINGGASQDDVTITVLPAPVANAGIDQTITLPTSSVTVSGSGSTGTITSYLWSRTSGPNTPTFTNATGVSTNINGLIAGTYDIQLSLNGGASIDHMIITVNPAPVLNTANAGPDQTITLPTSSVLLTSAASTGTITTRNWTRVSGPNTPTITTPTGTTTTVTGLIVGTYIFRVTLNGGNFDDVQINVNNVGSLGYTIFTVQSPSTTELNDGSPLTLGVRFTVSVPAYVTAIKFYKTAANTGIHTGRIFSNTGAVLGSVTFTSETATGWQVATFTTPIAISAGTIYVAAYFSPTGIYTSSNNYWTAPVTNGIVSGIADNTTNHNGIFRYGTPILFPNSFFNKSNYWVDVVVQDANTQIIRRHTTGDIYLQNKP